MLSVDLKGDRELILRLQAMPDQLRSSLGRTITRLAIELERRAKIKVSGEMLKVRSGIGRASIHHQVTETATGVTATVGTNIFYMKIQHEGVPHSWKIQVKSARALAFEVGGHSVFAKWVIHPPLPPHPFLTEPLHEMTPQIMAEIEAAVKQTVAAR